ncbi:MAG: PEP-CTERM sorting domain-containing protein [Myxococcota bacterium]
MVRSSMKIFRRIAGSLLVLLSAGSAEALPFDINVIFGSGLTASQQAIFTQAETTWEGLLPGYQPGINIPTLDINASGLDIDGVGGVLGQAGPTSGTSQGGYILSTIGVMQFDTSDLLNLETNGTLFDVIVHEMGHVMGLGTLWELNGVYIDGSGHYTGAAGLAAYRAEFDPSAAFVPVELDGGPGTANGHWDETWAGGPFALMTGFINVPTFISNTTVRSFVDLGFIPEPSTALLLGLGLGLIGFSARSASRQE